MIGAAPDEEVDRHGQGAAGREHRVEDVALPTGQIIGKALGIRLGLEGLLIADHAEEADLGRRQEALHSVEHAEACAEDRYDERARAREAYADGLGHRCLDLNRLYPDVAGGLVRQKRDQFVGQPPECRRIGALVAQDGELVGDQRVIRDMNLHVTSLAARVIV